MKRTATPSARSRGRWLRAALLWAAAGAAGAADLPARLDWGAPVQLSTPASGVIAAVPVVPGQRVTRGTLLVELDSRGFQARVDRARAVLEQARQDRDEALRERERTLELFDRTLLSVHERQLAEVAAAAARAAHARARAELTEAELELEYSRVTAPLDGRVLAVPARVGETVVSRLQARPLVVLAPLDRMQALARIPADDLPALQVGDPVAVTVAGQRHAGRLEGLTLETAGSGDAPRVRLEVGFAVPADAVLHPGQAATLHTEN
jgi:multidrug efflux system membrane fusion protein